MGRGWFNPGSEPLPSLTPERAYTEPAFTNAAKRSKLRS
ncbi:MAG: hypothetical protein BWY59_01774 [Verrucomicrobia bacterium ADurb.Bin345]|nr:MAG: hypothetical protein BWY59_01774 [Verrucomicrobia bacterium ADurb.Bin345]